ncbi:peptidoglycan DD-metalloendopeptidase family protein [Natronospira bacteriovora]|uniref:Peptidoglycan DD-metalloendopeptidase family protein n=1 Tax=Natronospira bacteriovora TaxID=3069753 RepID=A0ABU0W954_9GAMM|nr:peptidoglycan DD-metalloendopeptidase family protein [Natronospira sp. AB-CW4]MDQ2070571.1 peptidoglycan DD-metalloendopeptidase family protein [Natronospira sp. AB-CW4]
MVLITSLSATSSPETPDTLPRDLPREMALPLPVSPLTRTLLQENTLAASNLRERTLEVRSGESLARVFGRNGLNSTDLHFIMSLGGETESLARLRPGDRIQVSDDGSGNVLALSRQIDPDRILHVRRGERGFEKHIETLPLQLRVNFASGTINRSLYQDARAAGLSNNLIMNLAGVFQWDIDFVLDIREGDEFVVIYEEYYRDGEKVRDGDILAAEIVNRGNRIQAVRYTDPSGRTDFYSPNGDSMRRTFLRAPLEYMRISSHFNPNRRHPVLNRIRAHRGVDYAAPTGTPIRAAGDGRITLRGRHGGLGNTVQIQHGERYSTLYAHMSRFARGHQVGSRVRQGEVIGYVGQTGLATGPHLHYEFLVDGVHRNPVTVDFPAADPVPERYRDDFLTTTATLIAHLDIARPGERLAERSD